MSSKPSIREALHVVADALADALEGRASNDAAPVKAPKAKAVNNDLATELARKECLKNGWPLPPNTRRSA